MNEIGCDLRERLTLLHRRAADRGKDLLQSRQAQHRRKAVGERHGVLNDGDVGRA